ncbi:glycosyltransferase family 1 protein [Rhizophagus irregularis DAOM 181602=DAOM 197198]|nr:glycosyltransferase family 1 protein [Rhizophagus irregularis DAOM 181602=DAOM 197198]
MFRKLDQYFRENIRATADVALALIRYTLNANDIINKIDFLLKDEKVKKNSKSMINSKRKYRAADLIEYILYDSSLNEGVNEEFLKE